MNVILNYFPLSIPSQLLRQSARAVWVISIGYLFVFKTTIVKSSVYKLLQCHSVLDHSCGAWDKKSVQFRSDPYESTTTTWRDDKWK